MPSLKKVLSIRGLHEEMSGIHNVEKFEKGDPTLHRELSEYGRRRGTDGP